MRGPRVCLCLVLLVGGLAAQSAPAHAAQPSTNALEQHWELLAETGSYTGSKTLEIRRGDLPGGITKFEPAPTATLEVVGMHTGGSGASKWEVALMATSTEVLATVDFLATDGTLKIKTAAITWPSSNKALRSLRLTKINDVPNLAGTFVIQKAYIKIAQTGVIKKTVGRVPIATKQTSITNTDWQDLTEVAFYQHLPASFDPAPTIVLRTTGVEVTANPIIATLHVRLVDSSGALVAGSEHEHAAIGNVNTGALTLAAGGVYKVQAKVTMVPQHGDLYSADIVLEQSSSSADGLKRTVAWYPSVTAATDLAADGFDLGYLFNAPANSIPERSRTWTYSARRLTGTEAGVAFRDTTAASTLASSLVSAPDFAFEGVTVPSDPPPGNDVDSRSIVATGSSGRVSASALRVAVDLQSASAPIVSPLGVSVPAISPNGDGVKDAVTITTSINDVSSVSWSLGIVDPEGTTVRSFTGSSPTVSVAWDGLRADGTVAPDASYALVLAATDVVGNVTTVSGSVIADLTPPDVVDIVPAEATNTLFTTQPIFAYPHDGTAGIDSQTLVIRIKDVDSGTVSDLALASYDSESGWARSVGATLIVGHEYQTYVGVTDLAGNTATWWSAADRPFRASSLTVGSMSASIPRYPCSLGSIDPGTGRRTVTCTNVPLRMSSGSVTMAGSRSTGVGGVRNEVTLSAALVETDQNGVPSESAYRATDSAWGNRLRITSFDVSAPFTDTLTLDVVAPADGSLGTLTTDVPASWPDAFIRMPATATVATPFACSDPFSNAGCSTDPLVPSIDWRPPAAANQHFGPCDGAISHKELVAVSPGQALGLTLTVDTARLTVGSVTLSYRVNEGALTEQVDASSGLGQYSFSIPASSLSEGSRLDYAFGVVGTFNDLSCVSYTRALSPANGAFHTLATATTSSLHPALATAIETSMRLGRMHPSLSRNPTAAETCSTVFASPTPCELVAGFSPPTQPPPQVSGGSTAVVSTDNIGSGTCTKNQPESGFYKDGPHTYTGSATSYSVPSSSYGATPRVASEFEAEADANDALGDQGAANGFSYTGYRFVYADATPGIQSYTMHVELRWRVVGLSGARVLPGRIVRDHTHRLGRLEEGL